MLRRRFRELAELNPYLAQQLLVGSVGLGVFLTALAMLRRQRLVFSSGMLWIGMGLLGLLGAALLPLVNTLGTWLGVVPAAVLAALASGILGAIAFLHTLGLSKLDQTVQNVAEHAALASTPPPVKTPDGDSILAIVPAFNEAPTIEGVVLGLRELGLQVLVVNDASTDSTSATARAAGAVVLSLPTNLGVGGALRAGLRYALLHGFTAVIQCDGDGQHPQESVAELLHHPHGGIDLLIGSRWTEGHASVEGIWRRLAIRALSYATSRRIGQPLTDTTSGLRIIREPLLGQLALRMQRHYLGDTVEIVTAAALAGYDVSEVPVKMLPRSSGESTASPWQAAALTIRALLTILLGAHVPLARKCS